MKTYVVDVHYTYCSLFGLSLRLISRYVIIRASAIIPTRSQTQPFVATYRRVAYIAVAVDWRPVHKAPVDTVQPLSRLDAQTTRASSARSAYCVGYQCNVISLLVVIALGTQLVIYGVDQQLHLSNVVSMK